jgi:hypothetical protein
MGTTYSPASPPPWTVLERDGYRYPPGLQLNLPFYLLRRFFKPGNPIALFQHLAQTYGRMAHYRLGPQATQGPGVAGLICTRRAFVASARRTRLSP